MSDTAQNRDFYQSLVDFDAFADVADTANYQPLPDDWWIGTSDLVGSTQAIEDGLYKTVNMIAAAVISGQINAHDGAAFPFVFGGDGASFAVPPQWKDRAEAALAAVRVWAREEFAMTLRVAITPVSDIRRAGKEVRVARYRASEHVSYAMFSGGGVSWAENQMKAGETSIPEAPAGARPDLTGLSCRWSHMPSQQGKILSIVVVPGDTSDAAAFSHLTQEAVRLVRGLRRSGHPAEDIGPGVDWPPIGATLEAHAQRGGGSLNSARRKALFESFVAWLLIKTGWKVGGFDARRYRRVVGNNADFRKFEDGLKMTLDCDPATETKLRALLQQAADAGVARYGIHAQSEAMMTCIVPSIQTDNHVHFIDGASGGYTAAAQSIKSGN